VSTSKTQVLPKWNPTRRWGVRVAESDVEPPRTIPNRVVPGVSAGEYCVGDRVGGEAVARTPQRLGPWFRALRSAGWSSGSSLGS
jgi:hypothetical protein